MTFNPKVNDNELISLLTTIPNVRSGWFSIRSQKEGFLAFMLHRLTGIVLSFYLLLHLIVLRTLAYGPTAWETFLQTVKSPVFSVLDGALLFCLIFHGINGIRLSIIGFNKLIRWQKELFYLTILTSFVFSLMGTFLILF
jgi:succinate dehydrogenase / fumarate reductase cytochrome b subunit